MNFRDDEGLLTHDEKIELALRKLRPVVTAIRDGSHDEASTLVRDRTNDAFQQLKLSVIDDLRVRIGDDATDAALSMLAE